MQKIKMEKPMGTQNQRDDRFKERQPGIFSALLSFDPQGGLLSLVDFSITETSIALIMKNAETGAMLKHTITTEEID